MEIKYIALHNTAVLNTGNKQIHAVNEYHRTKKTSTGDWQYHRGLPSKLGWWVAYNFFCDVDGKRTQTREIGEETFCNKGHNCDVPVRCDTISYCMAGAFDRQLPTTEQEADFSKFVDEMRDKYGSHIRVVGHRDLQGGRTCPEVAQSYIDKFNRPKAPEDLEKSKELEELQRQIESQNALIKFLLGVVRRLSGKNDTRQV